MPPGHKQEIHQMTHSDWHWWSNPPSSQVELETALHAAAVAVGWS